MQRATYATAVLILVLLGVWGCGQGPTVTAQAERIKTLESKVAKLESELRTTVGNRDTLREQLKEAEEHIQKLQLIVKERDDLRIQLKLRTGERDQLAAQYDTFRKSIKELLGQAEAAVLRTPNGDPVTVTVGPRALAAETVQKNDEK